MEVGDEADKSMRIRIEQVILREIRIPFLHFFQTSFGRSDFKEALLVEVRGEGLVGWGECVASEDPFYSYEDCATAWHILRNFLVPLLADEAASEPEGFERAAAPVRGHPMAKSAVECALWDLQSQAVGRPLWQMWSGQRRHIPCGVSIGIQEGIPALLEKIGKEVADGYRRIKIKIAPGWDLEVLEAVRNRFPEVPLMVDANAAYTLEDVSRLKQMDDFDLLMIEQPLHYEDLLDHSRLQSELRTPVCLDESIRHLGDAILAHHLGACGVINIKMGRVGGPLEARRIHDFCLEKQMPVWCGGMLETGIGRAHNVALSTLPNFSLPGDVSASRRYFAEDLIEPAVEVIDGMIQAPDAPGIGYRVNRERVHRVTVREEGITFGPQSAPSDLESL